MLTMPAEARLNLTPDPQIPRSRRIRKDRVGGVEELARDGVI
jgi:hypothetical protein